MRARTLALTSTGLALAVVLTACGTNDESSTGGMGGMGESRSNSTSSASTADAADVAFAQLMIAHHQQAIEMADLASKSAQSTQVKDLAAQIKGAQGPEVETMTQWLQEWEAPMTMPSGDGDMGDMDMGGMGAAGMMSDAEMKMLATSRGAEFDQMWLQMMIAHHQGAITMAQQVLDTTNTAEVTALAEDVVQAQQVEIETMQQLLTQ
ncbi:MAG: DUF305 domain-containing protein [Candidatus Nanopelagicales bacterium]|jgi:uncharacterized protein (DUF305 family)|nr:DUF305 domain-containing protein [Candidatus Nanopelagicales bacterium]MCU0296951.1 DUF305 domain-containing protein [Candidatus Nanopelagicales bacterium]